MQSLENIKKLLDSLERVNENVDGVREYIKTNYDVESRYDDASGELHIWCDDAEKAVNVKQAKEYIDDQIGEELVQVIYGK